MPKKKTLNEFITDAKKVHGNKYTYSNTEYINAHTKILVTCSKHGDFSIKPCSHTISKQGCPACAGNIQLTTAEFIKKANKAHNKKYDYTSTAYTTSHQKVTIKCNTHGQFSQKAYVHLAGHGCPKCGSEEASLKNQEKPDIWSYRGWEEAGNSSSQFEEYAIYIIECWNEAEHFIKIGKTFLRLKRRFSGKALPYSWRLIYKETGSADYISNLEESLHQQLKHHKHAPAEEFTGYKECYTVTTQNLAKDIINNTQKGIAEWP